ncbi:MAG TPA: alpha-hydroxy acid oxidase [Streptosporangiaceae bacterium]|jgi:L-lactate dehydrogenase (cytochrome)|nr:alpha-hydroxy acid oxidase [Streptosporangiaceae bacterium]
MRASEIRQLIRMKPVELDATRRRLSACHDIADLRATGRRLTPRPVFDYVDGGADEELSVHANTKAFRRWRFQPRTLVNVSDADTSTAFLGSVVPLPLALAPTGYTRMMHPDGEIAAARAAQRHGLPYTLSTMATTTIEAVAEALSSQPTGPDRPPGQPDLWFQLYILRDSGLNKELVDRAAAAKYRVLVVTVDCFVTGHRTRDRRNGLVIPPELTARTLVSIAGKPGYWTRMLRSPAIGFANFTGHDAVTIEDTGALFNPAITWDDIAELRARWPGRLVVKGPLGPADCLRAVSAGADGVQLSNHGGRQLDRAVPPVDTIAAAREAVGPDVSVLVDSGIRHGSDIAVALALGADACAIGRAYLYGLMAGGEPGVNKALDILAAQFKRTMQLLGVSSVAELRSLGRELLVGGS